MKTNDPPTPTPHDDREIDARTIVRWAAGLAVVTVATMGFAVVFLGWLSRSEQSTHTQPPPIATALPTAPPEPRLQASPPASLRALRAHEEETLTSYRWVSTERGVVSIPIADAIEMVARRGLPSRAEAPSQRHVTVPTHSSLMPPTLGGPP